MQSMHGNPPSGGSSGVEPEWYRDQRKIGQVVDRLESNVSGFTRWISLAFLLAALGLATLVWALVEARAALDYTIQVKGGEVVERGIASRYGYDTGAPACGIPMVGKVAAHKTLKCGTYVRVTREDTGKSVVVQIIDRGPFVRGRIIDLSPVAAREIGLSGLAPVKVEVVK